MRQDKIFALLAYLIQALSTLGVVFAVSHFLDAASYGRYSLVVATSQTVAVFAAEWIRLGALRFCAADASDMHQRVSTIQSVFFGICGSLALVVTGLGLVGVMPLQEALLGLTVAVLMGATDLQLVFLRVRGSFNGFAKLQCARAIVLLISSTAGAVATHSQLGALAGLSVGYLISMVMFVRADPSWWRLDLSGFSLPFLKQLAVYGMAAAGASMIHSLVPMGMRWTGQGIMTAAEFAAFSLAIDLLQRPFALVTSAIGGIFTPGVIKEFEEQLKPRLPKLKQLYEVQFWAVIVLMGGALAFIPEVGQWAVKEAMRAGFESVGAVVAMIFGAHIVVQTIMATPGHLLKSGHGLITNAVVEVVLVGMACLAGLVFDALRPVDWLWLVLGAIVLCDFFGARLMRRVPCEFPTALALTGPAVAVAMGLFNLWDTGDHWQLGLLKCLAFAGLMAVCGLWVKRMIKARAA